HHWGLIARRCSFYNIIVVSPISRESDYGICQWLQAAIYIISLGHAVALSFLCLCCLVLDRCPAVYVKDHAVDKEDSASILSPTLKQVASSKSPEPRDLPCLPSRVPSTLLHKKLKNATNYSTLSAILLQQTLTLASTCLGFTSQFALLHILKWLEDVPPDPSAKWAAMRWVLALAALMVLTSVVDLWLLWLYWLVIFRIGIPIREQLSSVIYAKALRSNKYAVSGRETEKSSKQDGLKEEAGLPNRGLRQNVNNLVTLNAKRVSEMAAYSYATTSAISKFAVACAFLLYLMGWHPTSNQFAKSQTTLMAYRDQKNTALNEALKGIRDIKVQVQEDHRHTRISKIRRKELKAQWACFLCDIKLITIFMLGPVALAAASLGTYFARNMRLTSPVAFTASAAFSSLTSFANLPEMTAFMAEAYISLGETFLNMDDLKPETLPSDTGYRSNPGADQNPTQSKTCMNPGMQQRIRGDSSQMKGVPSFYLSIYMTVFIFTCLAGPQDSISFSLPLSKLLVSYSKLDNVPIGRIMNRFTTDMTLVDAKLGYELGALLHALSEVIGIAACGLFVSPTTLILSFIPTFGVAYYTPKYLTTAREIKRLESASMTPILEHIRSSIAGLTTIRAFSNVPPYMSQIQTLLDEKGQASWHLWLFNRWFNFRVNLTETFYCILTAVLLVSFPWVDASMAGFVLSFAPQYPAAIL
ncbi:ATP-dependent bile acid permease, partial [Talaromyces pinophilus]